MGSQLIGTQNLWELLIGTALVCTPIFPTKLLELVVQKKLLKKYEAFRPVVKEHTDVYGADNDQRLTGDHETQSTYRSIQLRCF